MGGGENAVFNELGEQKCSVSASGILSGQLSSGVKIENRQIALSIQSSGNRPSVCLPRKYSPLEMS